MNLLSILIGLFALPFAVLAFLPLLGWMYWFVVPLAIAGCGVGVLSRCRSGRTLNLLVIVVGIVRLVIGHGIF